MLSEALLGSLMFCDNGAAHRCDVGVRSAFEHLPVVNHVAVWFAASQCQGSGETRRKRPCPSEPEKSVDKAKAKVHKAKAHHHAKAAKEAAKEIPK
jgi:hypothetical protein